MNPIRSVSASGGNLTEWTENGMAEILKGKPAADAIDTAVKARADALIQRGIAPTLAIIRVGDDPDDCAYERGAMKRCSRLGISVRNVVFTDSVRQETIMDSIDVLNEDPNVDGILMLLPLPGNLNTRKACEKLSPSKDVDGVTQGSCAYLYSGYGTGFAPCTAEACIELLKYYQVPMKGSRIVVVGRSLVIGKPVSMLLLNENATVTVCHSKTVNLSSVTREADIVIAALGRPEFLDGKYFREGQTVVDVGINWSEEKQKLVGDVRFDEAEKIVSRITPVPGGVGSVTTAVLCAHVVKAAEMRL